MRDDRGRKVPRTWSRAHIVEVLRKAGYTELADEAAQTLPVEVDEAMFFKLSQEHGISRDDLVDSMGGSP